MKHSYTTINDKGIRLITSIPSAAVIGAAGAIYRNIMLNDYYSRNADIFTSKPIIEANIETAIMLGATLGLFKRSWKPDLLDGLTTATFCTAGYLAMDAMYKIF